jgi:hypothetical protein
MKKSRESSVFLKKTRLNIKAEGFCVAGKPRIKITKPDTGKGTGLTLSRKCDTKKAVIKALITLKTLLFA